MATKTIIAWIDGSAQEIEVEEMTSEAQVTIEDRLSYLENNASSGSTYTTISLPASSWTGSESPYSQVVTITNTTANTKVDIDPTASQLVEMENQDFMLVAENENGVITIKSLNNKPEVDYEVQVVLTEVSLL